MDQQMLVAYATKLGGTAEIAEQIGQVLRENGLHTDVMPVGEVDELTPYRSVVLGSALYMGQWRKDAARFLEGNEGPLAERYVWLFSSGPTGEGDPVELMEGRLVPEELQSVVESIEPEGIAVFHGRLIRDQLSFFERWIIRMVKAPLGDFRDWDAIRSWAAAIADTLRAEVDE